MSGNGENDFVKEALRVMFDNVILSILGWVGVKMIWLIVCWVLMSLLCYLALNHLGIRTTDDSAKIVTSQKDGYTPTPHNTECEVIFDGFGDHSHVKTPPKLSNIRVEHGPREHLTLKTNVHLPCVCLKVVSSQRTPERLLVSNFDVNIVDLRGECEFRNHSPVPSNTIPYAPPTDAQRLSGEYTTVQAHVPEIFKKFNDSHLMSPVVNLRNESNKLRVKVIKAIHLGRGTEEILFELYDGSTKISSEDDKNFLGLTIVNLEEIKKSGEFDFYYSPKTLTAGKVIDTLRIRNSNGSEFRETITTQRRAVYDPHDNYDNPEIMPTKTTTVVLKAVSQVRFSINSIRFNKTGPCITFQHETKAKDS
uniref:CUB domain-containing protein n=1 Tax=Angiostrongylus cantonensis TaxID=6313 RepID=A0A0K0D2A5_ANGCA